MSATIDAIVVAIPAHDEEELLDACLTSVIEAVDAVRPRVRAVSVRVALDRCTDGSAEIARRLSVPTVAVDAGAVGVARAAAVAAGLADIGRLARIPRRVWTAHTDADSTVPEHWIAHQLDLAQAGADVVIGTVRPRFADLSEQQVRAWQATHTPGEANGHVHGANLGIRADVLLRAGGFPALAVHEDVRLIERVRALGARFAASDLAWVSTSGRAVGRAPDGYARYLRDDLVALAHSNDRHADVDPASVR